MARVSHACGGQWQGRQLEPRDSTDRHAGYARPEMNLPSIERGRSGMATHGGCGRAISQGPFKSAYTGIGAIGQHHGAAGARSCRRSQNCLEASRFRGRSTDLVNKLIAALGAAPHWIVITGGASFARFGTVFAHGAPPRVDACATVAVMIPTPPSARVAGGRSSSAGHEDACVPVPPLRTRVGDTFVSADRSQLSRRSAAATTSARGRRFFGDAWIDVGVAGG